MEPEKKIETFDIDRAVYMIEWRDREIARLSKRLEGVGDVLNVVGAYIMVLAAGKGLPVRIDKAEIAEKIKALDGKIAWRDVGDAIVIEVAEEAVPAEGGDTADGKEAEEAQG